MDIPLWHFLHRRSSWFLPFIDQFLCSILRTADLTQMVFKKLVDSFVINMELSPSTREIIYQKYSIVSGVVTKRVSVDDL